MDAISDDLGTRRTFNEVFCTELHALRPGIALPSPAATGATDEVRAANLRDYFKVVGSLADTQPTTPEDEPLTALCLSGGGIRSATFNLGVIQRLAKIGLLGKFDYLSSVSGGGYVAGWLRTWMRREGVETVIRKLASSATEAGRDPLKPDPPPVEALREYSNYLTPQVGLFSGDTWTAAAIVVRNLLLNWLILLPLVASALALPLVFLLFVRGNPITSTIGTLLLYAALGIELVASYLIHSSRRFRKEPGTPQWQFLTRCVAPIWLAALCLAIASLGLTEMWGPRAQGHAAHLWTFAAAWSIAAPLVGWGITELRVVWFLTRPKRMGAASGSKPERIPQTLDLRQVKRRYEFMALVISGAVATAVLVGCVNGMYGNLYEHPALYVILVNPILLGIYLLSRVLFVGIASLGENARPTKNWTPSDDDADREWWARLSGWILLLALIWLGVTALCLLGTYLPDFIAHIFEESHTDKAKELAAIVRWVVGALGTASGAIAALIGTSASSPVRNNIRQSSATTSSKVALSIAGPLFIVCVLIVLSWAVKALSDNFWGSPPLFDFARDWRRFTGHNSTTIGECARFLWVPVGLAALSFIAGFAINVNRFSLHGMYRNRLVRAYLGASNVLGNDQEGRRPDPFTGFARSDNLALADLWPHDTLPLDSQARTSSLLENIARSAVRRFPLNCALKGAIQPNETGADEASVTLPKDHPHTKAAAARRPLPIFNTTLNLVNGENLAWQERKAESFSMTPFYCGNVREGYRPSDKYAGTTGITVGNAITISGAAANPNMGYSSSPVLSFIMTLFNVRLGVWLGNTNQHGNDTYFRSGPLQAINPLLAELFGMTNSSRRYVNLSDGGHFDNLGLYEVVLRRCRQILVCDADADASFAFENLGNAIRKIRIDFGINITFKAKILIVPRDSRERRALYCAIASIGYRDVDGTQDGTLIYIKPTIHGRGGPVPYDVYSYALANTTFPHESTVDQWFSESQFESYRALGYHIIEQLAPKLEAGDFKAFEKAVCDYISGKSEQDGVARSHTSPMAVPPMTPQAAIRMADRGCVEREALSTQSAGIDG